MKQNSQWLSHVRTRSNTALDDLGAERLAGPSLEADALVEPAATELDVELGLVDQQLPLDDVARHLAVERDDLVARAQTGPLGGGPCRDADDHRS